MLTIRPPFTTIVEGLPDTVPFTAPEVLERQAGRPLKLRLGANESVFGMSPRAREAMAAALEDTWHYGDPESHALRAALARRLGVGVERVTVGSGIDELLGILVRIFVEPGGAVVASLGSYPTFHYHVAGHGGMAERVPYRDGWNDLQALADAAKRVRPRAVYLANPDNPTGTWHTAADIRRLLAELPPDCLFILDEAYVEFLPSGHAPPMDVADPRLIRLRTFSKAYGMAGARIGYAIAHEEIISAFNKTRNHFGVNLPAQAGALAALEDEDFLRGVLREIETGREDYHQMARELGWPTLPSATNLVAMDLGGRDAARGLLNALLDRDIFIRMPGAPPLDRYVRVTVGNAGQRALLREALHDIQRTIGPGG